MARRSKWNVTGGPARSRRQARRPQPPLAPACWAPPIPRPPSACSALWRRPAGRPPSRARLAPAAPSGAGLLGALWRRPAGRPHPAPA
ncbi:hypothetical protein HF086_012357 [Spodoptera exigua]|uniref:Uncharacterized protein n=1 Tax=Spodoptera exigua TaxID=7107 RepID=A0A922MA23_SPOEX|nr:hypothetical protein HF086_012357 [Spodoptera exigua]